MDEDNEEGIVERPDDGRKDLELAVISLAFIKVNIDESTEVAYLDKVMEVLATLDVMAMAAMVAAVSAAASCGRLGSLFACY